MTIPGVKAMTKQTLTSYRITLDRAMTNGHDFCELIIDEANRNFIARLYGGEMYTYGFGGSTGNFIDFLIDTFRNEKDHGYLYTKLQNHQLTDLLDTEKIGNHFLEIAEEAKNEGMDEYDYDELIESIESFQNEDPMTESHFYNMYFTWFEQAIQADIFSSEPWEAYSIERKEDEDCRVFCQQVAPILADFLEAQQNAQ